MSSQVAHLVYAQVDASAYAGDEAIYTFTGGLHGAGLEFTFGLFALAQGKLDDNDEAGHLLRNVAHRLLRDIYMPLLPWEGTDRPNPLDSLETVMSFEGEDVTSMTVAVTVGDHVYLGWKGDGRAFLITTEGVEPVVSEDETPIASHTIAEETYLLLCASNVCQEVSTDEVFHIVHQAPGLQSACDQLAQMATPEENGQTPLMLLIYRPN